MAKISTLVMLPPVIFAGLAGLFGFAMWQGKSDELPSTFIGVQAPAVPVESVNGTVQLTDADLRSGEVTLVNFWASWCPPCRAEHPVLMDLADQGYRIAGVNFRDAQDQAVEYLAEEGDPFFASGFDARGRVAIDWGVTAPPETFIVDGDGTILFRFVGPLVGSDYEQRFLPELLKAME